MIAVFPAPGAPVMMNLFTLVFFFSELWPEQEIR
jgi:hypothetical protein